jgi:hypothetical protein
MFAACQRLRRRALVMLAWLVLALSVAPAPGELDVVRPVAAFVSVAARASVWRSSVAGAPRVARVTSWRIPRPRRSPSILAFRQARRAPRTDTSSWPAPDERWLYLENNALLC